MEAIAKKLGEVAINALVDAIRQGKSRREAVDAAADSIKRSDVVSDELWDDLERYIDETADFEEHGAG